MTRAKFKELTGEYPEDVLGEDWENEIDDYINSQEGNEHFHDGHQSGGCFTCKMD